ncbi:hypothetical protein [Herbaspirillum sp. NPDC101396]|uniref:hypothetical protein n=1 Tax=Herbaspirillum sp. NPDC101396 TaxID=3364005 RepID=UPI00383A278B
MDKIKISRTAALGRLRKRLSHPVKHLNTIIVGLDGVRNGSVVKSEDLSVRWEVGDPVRTTDEARGFAIVSLVVAACDSLDQYLRGLGNAPSPISNPALRSLLRGESQYDGPSSTQPSKEHLEQLIVKLSPLRGKDGRDALKEFSNTHYGQSKKPSLRARFDALKEYIDDLPRDASAPAELKDSYAAAITLLIVWRNVVVHEESKDGLDSAKRKLLTDDAQYFKTNHADIDISKTLAQFEKRLPPTLKDASTLVSVLLRTVASLDASLIYHTNTSDYFREIAWSRIKVLNQKVDFVDRLKGASLAGRMRRLLPYLSGCGFVPEKFMDKADSPPAITLELKDTFLAEKDALDFLLQNEYVLGEKRDKK